MGMLVDSAEGGVAVTEFLLSIFLIIRNKVAIK